MEAFGSVSPHSLTQAGDDGCVYPDSPPHPPLEPIWFDKHGKPLTAVSLLSCHVFGNRLELLVGGNDGRFWSHKCL